MVNSFAPAGSKAKVDAPKDLTKAIVSTQEVLKRYTKEEVAKVSLAIQIKQIKASRLMSSMLSSSCSTTRKATS